MIKDLTEGNSRKILWGFSIPMFVSVIFQQFYNIADSVIAGKFAGEDALAAVGASYPITMIFMAIAIGSNIGCTVVISQLFGAKQYEKMKTAIATTMLTSLALSLVLITGGLAFCEALMSLIKTPENIFSDACLYLKIYIGGFAFLFLYNLAAGVFHSLGDSKTPLYFLIGSSIGNVVLDLLFVAVLHWGVKGVAWATFLAQGIACLLALLTLKGRVSAVKTNAKIALFSIQMLKRISKVAIPSILQQSFISVGNLLIQVLINGFGSSVIAGYAAAVKLNTFTVTSFTTLGNAVSAFTAQNIGAKKVERVREGFRAGVTLVLIMVIPVSTLFFVFSDSMLRIFLEDGSRIALETGIIFLRTASPFYALIAVKLVADGVLRGAGAMKPFMIATFTDLVFRVLLCYLLEGPFGTMGIWVTWPIGWLVGAALSYGFYKKGVWKVKVKKQSC